jgi:formamidopyrimidine-DNA glycosylase
MPELPEVEAARRLVEEHCLNATIVELIALESGGGPRNALFDEIVCEGIQSPDVLVAAMKGKTLIASRRKGKQMWWELSSSAALAPDAAMSAATSSAVAWHFGMTGAFSVCRPDGAASTAKYKRCVLLRGAGTQRRLHGRGRCCGGHSPVSCVLATFLPHHSRLSAYSISVDVTQWPPRFTKVEVVFSNGVRLAFTDPRRLGRVRLVENGVALPFLAGLGPDAFTGMMPLAEFELALAVRSLPIKALLLDQAILAGIGNWIADEVLYQSGIHPETAAHALSLTQAAALHAQIVAVISTACSVDADSTKFPTEWLFHRRWGKGKGASPVTPAGHPITFITVGGRTSAVVQAVQGSRGMKTPASHVAAALRSTAVLATAARTACDEVAAAASAGACSSGASVLSAGAAALDAAASSCGVGRKRKASSLPEACRPEAELASSPALRSTSQTELHGMAKPGSAAATAACSAVGASVAGGSRAKRPRKARVHR